MTNRVLYALASRNDPGFTWVEFREPGAPETDPGPTELGWVPRERSYITRLLDQARPKASVDPASLKFLLQMNQPGDIPRSFVDFYRLPEFTRRLVSEAVNRPLPRVIAFANSELVRDYYPQNREGVRGFIEAFLDAGVHPMWSVSGLSGTPGDAASALDFLFLAEAPDLASAAGASLTCLQAPRATHWTPGTRIGLGPLLGGPDAR